MSGHGFSQKALTHDDIDEETCKEMDMLLKTISNAEADVSDGVLDQVRRFLDMVSEAWSKSPAPGKLLDIGIVRILATIYDNLIQTDYQGRSEVLASILELLFIVEDMSDSTEGKIQCGKLFLFRLMAFVTATSKTPSLKLQRAVIETICALVTRSPENQQALLDQKVECYKLFKLLLPKCGDFQLQASITEIFYRLAKRGPQLLQFIQDKDVKKSIETLIQSKKPDLLLEIRKIVTHLNESLGRLRSVYSFLAERILINGNEMVTSDKWVNIGGAQLSFYISGLPDSDLDQHSILDVRYEDIMEVKKSSPTLLEIHVQERAGLSKSFKVLGQESGSSTILLTQMYFNPADLSTIESSILPTIRAHLPCAFPVGKGLEGKNMNGHPGKKFSLGGDSRLPEQVESRGRNKKSSLDNVHNALDFVSETPQDVGTLKEAAIAKSSKSPGRHAQDCCKPQVVARSVPSTIALFNLLPVGTRQPFPNRQEDCPLQNSNTEPVDALRTFSKPPVDSRAEANHSRRVAIAATDGNRTCENGRASKPSHLMTQNLQALPGPKTKSPSDAYVHARVCNSDSETEDETDKSRRVGEVRMKKREDPFSFPLDSPGHAAGKRKSVRNTVRQVKDAYILPEVQRSGESSGKNPMPASDSVMTDIREKPVPSGKANKSCPKKSSRAVPNCGTGQADNGPAKNASRTLRKRQCNLKAVRYFDADDEHLSGASDSSTELVVTRQKKSKDLVTDPAIEKIAKRDLVTNPAIDKIAKRGGQTTTKRARCASAQEEKRDEVTPDQQGPKNAGISAFSRSSDRDKRSRSSTLQTRKTVYSKSDARKTIPKNSRLERWRSFSFRKLELPKMDVASEDESIDGDTAGSSPRAKLLEEDTAQDGEGSSDIGMIAILLKKFKHKVKLRQKKAVEAILSDTMQRIQHEIRSAEERIRGEKTDLADACNKKCELLDSQLQEQIKKMRALYDKFQQDFAQHLKRYDGIGCKIEETELELNDLGKQQAHEHKDVLAKLKESCKNHLADADQKILQVGKSSTGMHSLKEALQGLVKDL